MNDETTLAEAVTFVVYFGSVALIIWGFCTVIGLKL